MSFFWHLMTLAACSFPFVYCEIFFWTLNSLQCSIKIEKKMFQSFVILLFYFILDFAVFCCLLAQVVVNVWVYILQTKCTVLKKIVFTLLFIYIYCACIAVFIILFVSLCSYCSSFAIIILACYLSLLSTFEFRYPNHLQIILHVSKLFLIKFNTDLCQRCWEINEHISH